MEANNKLAYAVDLMDSPTFRTLVTNWGLIKASHKTEYDIQFAIASCGGAVLSALDQGRITFNDAKDRDLVYLALALLMRNAI